MAIYVRCPDCDERVPVDENQHVDDALEEHEHKSMEAER